MYNGIERQDELDLAWDLAQFRAYEPTLGRFMQIDPVIKEHESPYAWNTNNPILYLDPTGADSIFYNQKGEEINRISTKNDYYFLAHSEGNYKVNGENYYQGLSRESFFGDRINQENGSGGFVSKY